MYRKDEARPQRSRAAEEIGSKAYDALIEEVITTPKPGLVDLYSNGAHRDMDADTFRRSAAALYPFFAAMARAGLDQAGTEEELFRGLRKTGMEAEKAMYAATGGVNTHKGIIFTFGLFCAVAGRLLREGRDLTAVNLLETEQKMTVRILTEELEALRDKEDSAGDGHQRTHGEQNLRRYGTAGVRGEAIAGYPGVFAIGLPVLREGIRSGREWNRVKLQTLLTLMARTEDSNILSRGGMEELERVHEETAALLASGGAYRPDAEELLKAMDADYIRRNCSPGGCADLLAAAIFMHALTDDSKASRTATLTDSPVTASS